MCGSARISPDKRCIWRRDSTIPSSPSQLPSSRSCSTVTKKLMSTSYNGASGPSGHAGLLQFAPEPPVSRNHATPGLVLTSLEQPSQERLVFDQIKKLTVSLSVDTFNLRVNKLSGDTRTRSRNMTRYDPVPPPKYRPDRSVGVVCDEGNACFFAGTVG